MSCNRLPHLAIPVVTALGIVCVLLPGLTSARTTQQEPDGLYCLRGVMTDLLRKADQGDKDAQFVIASMYGAGHCLRQDAEKRWKWLQKAADQNHAEALFEVATAYYLGDGLKQDKAHAGRLYQRAAKLGHAGSQHQLGLMMLRNRDRTEDEKYEGLYWLGTSATNGNALSAMLVAYMHERGMMGVSADKCLAWDWYEASFLLGMQDAMRHMNRLEKSGVCADGR
ncbi:MAG: sel1 repeat family protein [Hyphomicrobiaceae bacterium]|nr:sel1 repeat family protein [Hyphomicrobiaceae bacterium]